MDRHLIDHLVSSGLATRADIQRKILKAKAQKVGVLSQIFADDHDEQAIATTLAEFYDASMVDEQSFEVNDTALKFLSEKLAKKHGVLPFEVNDAATNVTVAVFDPESAEEVLQTLRTATGSEPTIAMARKSWLEGAILHYYFDEPWADKPTPAAAAIPRSNSKKKEPEAGVNAIGRLKPKRRTIVTPISLDDPAQLMEESSEILLEEVINQQGREPKPARRASHPGTEIDQALEDFDSYLDRSSPGHRAMSDGNTSPPESIQVSAAEFDLFAESNVDEPQSDLENVVRTQAVAIAQLRKDVDHQRAIIQALVDILSEARLVSKREIKRRIDS